MKEDIKEYVHFQPADENLAVENRRELQQSMFFQEQRKTIGPRNHNQMELACRLIQYRRGKTSKAITIHEFSNGGLLTWGHVPPLGSGVNMPRATAKKIADLSSLASLSARGRKRKGI
ncbi:hypothetical protein PoB_006455400 [Plakobranchus ocellatus]|uniref:Uncharacterized protein n=1 Tax=Plakobranchus ocellatus TaxID=259542 RepID=A0AAV4D1E2_9GAST|nr:hypothetical protein PoB_006455400 [Plakobranchus ocellatus]